MLFSYSSLERAKACPARLKLSYGEYPSIWERKGFPGRVTYPAVRGLVIHRCMEALTKAAAETHEIGDRRAIAVRALGGFSRLIEDASRDVLADLAVNPRAKLMIPTWERRLAEDQESIRHRVQSTLRQLVVDIENTALNQSTVIGRKPIERGVFAEFYLRSSDLSLHGWADLFICDAPTDRMIDFKTGQESESHQDQLRLYAALWLADDRNAMRRPVEMTAIYDESEQHFGEMHLSEAVSVLDSWRERVEEAQRILSGQPAQASPERDLCSMCHVKVACDPYWIDLVAHEPVNELEYVDIEVKLDEQLGNRTWRISITQAPKSLSVDLLHTESHRQGLSAGDVVRILGASLNAGDEQTEPSLWAGRSAEIFALRADGLHLAGV